VVVGGVGRLQERRPLQPTHLHLAEAEDVGVEVHAALQVVDEQDRVVELEDTHR
jgi:hypothetical protein